MVERLYYLSHRLWKARVPFLPRLIMLVIRLLFQSYIPYQVEIGPGLSLCHGMGIMIGVGCKIGAGVKIHQFASIKGGSILDNDVIIGAGAKIIRKVRIGKGARIGANAVVLEDVPAYATVIGIPGRLVKGRGEAEKWQDASESGMNECEIQ
ncbi:MAG: hypothetical protein ABSC57_08840 [Syntrophales bacterium]